MKRIYYATPYDVLILFGLFIVVFVMCITQLNNQIFVIRVCRGICGLLCVNRMVIEQRRKALQIFTILEYLGK